MFPGVQKTTWTFDSVARAYYFHRFYEFQPDLNIQNPAVKEEIRKVMGYWLQLGVAGFRVDAVPFVLEEAPRGRGPAPMHFEYLEELRDFLQWRSALRLIVAPQLAPHRSRGERELRRESNV